MKTIREALKDELGNNTALLGMGRIENILIKRRLDVDSEFNADIAESKSFIGSMADCLFALTDTANFSESDISVSIADRNLILKKANLLYRAIGEEEKSLDQPTVCIGPSPGTYVCY